jgi:ABC-type dipeptide/oligopeptide/nickel transport system permease subunit
MAVTLSRDSVAYTAGEPAFSRSRAWRRFALNPAALTGSLILLVVVGVALAAPWVAPHDPAKQSLLRRFTPPVWQAGGNAAYPLGTDQVGRDVLSRIVHGARISLLVAVSAVIVSLLVGVTAGLVSGFVGGKVDTVIGTVVDITLSFRRFCWPSPSWPRSDRASSRSSWCSD